MSKWQHLAVTTSGQPVLLASERKVLTESNVGIYEGYVAIGKLYGSNVLTNSNYKPIGYQDGRVYLTTHRVCYVDNVNPRTHSVYLNLSQVKDVQHYSGFLRSSPKIAFVLGESETSSVVSRTVTPSAPTTWVCPICFFVNDLALDYEDGVSPLPVCKTCGIAATAETISKAVGASKQPDGATATRLERTAGMSQSNGSSKEPKQCPRCTFLNHPSMRLCEMCQAPLASVSMLARSDRQESPAPTAELGSGGGDGSTVKLSFRGGGDKPFYRQLKVQLGSRSWEHESSDNDLRQSRPNSGDASGVRGPGLFGLQQSGESVQRRRQEVLGSSLEDLETLMAQAKEVAKLAEQFAAHLEKEDLRSNDASSQSRRLLRQSSEALGLSSTVVTKEMAHDQTTFHAELARQLSEFLEKGVLAREGGAITLFDLYAVYNRARGISLISPKDLLAACELFETLRLPFRVRKFKSGLVVVQEAYRTPQFVVKSLLDWLSGLEPWQAEVGVSAQQVSAKFGWSVSVAVEELDYAESIGAICRDEHVAGLRFFPNLIVPYNITQSC